MMEENTEGLDVFQRVTVKNGVPVAGKVIWIVDESVSIIDGRIKFYCRELDCIFDIPVKQMKGQGTYYSKSWKKLPKQNLDVLTWWIEQGSEYYETYHGYEDLLTLIKAQLSISTGAFQGRISELRGLKLLFQDPDKKDHWKLDWSRAKEIIANDGKL